jgi:hypothetical protein
VITAENENSLNSLNSPLSLRQREREREREREPVAGPEPPPYIVVIPEAMASLHCCFFSFIFYFS